MSTAKELLARGCAQWTRKLSMKRSRADSTYEPDWQDISSYVVAWPTISHSFGDNVAIGSFEIETFTLELNNTTRKFNNELDCDSLFYQYLTRNLTRYKIEVNLVDDDDSSVTGLTFYGIQYGEMTNADDGIISIPVSGLLKVFDLYPATYVAVTSTTTQGMVQRLYDSAVNSVKLFDKFFEASPSLNPDSDTVMTIGVPSVLDNQTVWKKIQDYSVFENFMPYVSNSGGFVWTNRTETAANQWDLNGPGSNFKSDYGINILQINEDEGIRYFFPYVSVEYADDTFVTATTAYVPGDAGDVDKYGNRMLNYTYHELAQAEAQTVADTIRDAYNAIKRVWNIKTIFIPGLNPKDKVTINYLGELAIDEKDVFILDVSKLGTGKLASFTGPINLDGVEAKIMGISYNLNDFECEFICLEV